VETKEQHKMLSGLQCDAFQGYLFARPGPADQMHAAMEENAA
jgi:EAL domain-containing protein (putative c-di-GMP-specific phosphodiesterase class I)